MVLLALHRGHVVPVEHLVDVVWGEAPPKSAVVSVRVLVSRLRNTFAAAGHPDVIRTVSPGYVLAADQVNVDVDSFDELTARGRAQLAAGAVEDASETLQAALALWHGERLAESGNEQAARRGGSTGRSAASDA